MVTLGLRKWEIFCPSPRVPLISLLHWIVGTIAGKCTMGSSDMYSHRFGGYFPTSPPIT
jgi:hypothetical protein